MLEKRDSEMFTRSPKKAYTMWILALMLCVMITGCPYRRQHGGYGGQHGGHGGHAEEHHGDSQHY